MNNHQRWEESKNPTFARRGTTNHRYFPQKKTSRRSISGRKL